MWFRRRNSRREQQRQQEGEEGQEKKDDEGRTAPSRENNNGQLEHSNTVGTTVASDQFNNEVTTPTSIDAGAGERYYSKHRSSSLGRVESGGNMIFEAPMQNAVPQSPHNRGQGSHEDNRSRIEVHELHGESAQGGIDDRVADDGTKSDSIRTAE